MTSGQAPRLYLARLEPTGAVWQYIILDMERALTEAGVVGVPCAWGTVPTFFAKTMAKVGGIRSLSGSGPARAYLVPMMGPTEWRLFPMVYRSEVIPYIVDCWPKDYSRWEDLFRRTKTRVAFYTASQSAEYFTRRMPSMHSYWLPEGTDPSPFSGAPPLDDRKIDVLELGRRHARYHDAITPSMRDAGRVHLYERRVGEIVFQTRMELIAGYRDSKISIAFPSAITHPERSGDVAVLTQRYLESMAAGCLIVGESPPELRDLFGYDPVVPVDWDNPGGQLLELLHGIEDQSAIVHRNLLRLMEVGTWKERVRQLLAILGDMGYDLPKRSGAYPL